MKQQPSNSLLVTSNINNIMVHPHFIFYFEESNMKKNNTSNALQWRHNGRNSVSNHQPHDCLLNRRSKTTSKLRVTGLCMGNSPGTPHKWPVTWKMFPFDDVIMGVQLIKSLLLCVYKYPPVSNKHYIFHKTGYTSRFDLPMFIQINNFHQTGNTELIVA